MKIKTDKLREELAALLNYYRADAQAAVEVMRSPIPASSNPKADPWGYLDSLQDFSQQKQQAKLKLEYYTGLQRLAEHTLSMLRNSVLQVSAQIASCEYTLLSCRVAKEVMELEGSAIPTEMMKRMARAMQERRRFIARYRALLELVSRYQEIYQQITQVLLGKQNNTQLQPLPSYVLELWEEEQWCWPSLERELETLAS